MKIYNSNIAQQIMVTQIESRFWKCDHCCEKILKPSQGWVEWISDREDFKAQDIRIICNPLTTNKVCGMDLLKQFDTDNFTHTGKQLSHLIGRDGIDSVFNYLGIGEFSTSQAKELVNRLMFGDYYFESDERIKF